MEAGIGIGVGAGIEAAAMILIPAMVIEAVVQVIKACVPKKEGSEPAAWLWQAVAAVLGIALCLLSQTDILSMAGISLSAPLAGQALTGVIISRGAGFVHDLWAKLRGA